MSHGVHITNLGQTISASLVSIGTRIRAKTNVFIYPLNSSVCMIRCYGEDIGEFRPGGGEEADSSASNHPQNLDATGSSSIDRHHGRSCLPSPLNYLNP